MSADDVVHCPDGLPDDLDTIHPFQQGAQNGSGLHPGESLTGAGVGSVAETDVAAGIAADVEDFGSVPFVLVTVG